MAALVLGAARRHGLPLVPPLPVPPQNSVEHTIVDVSTNLRNALEPVSGLSFRVGECDHDDLFGKIGDQDFGRELAKQKTANPHRFPSSLDSSCVRKLLRMENDLAVFGAAMVALANFLFKKRLS